MSQSSTLTETLFRNKAENFGWNKYKNQVTLEETRTIKLGNIKNCNNDGLIRNYKVRQNIMDVLIKYDINDYIINEIDTHDELSYELQIKEEIYAALKTKMLSKG